MVLPEALRQRARVPTRRGSDDRVWLPSVREVTGLILAHQLIAAKLNIANNACGTVVAATIASADSVLSGFAGKLPYNVDPSSSTGQTMVGLADTLDSFNNKMMAPASSGCVAPF